ncbi:hypothetical protein CEXT_426391 [Caerostris extrusa]|uniref:Uncharacterized protein n=1 Tax=Caerostris extrusa TaxID=172846 RepID=A0AAV4Y2Y9_CAEEX|nr:hypothetical protein CEXT_426391 [Caerostris extrusa]
MHSGLSVELSQFKPRPDERTRQASRYQRIVLQPIRLSTSANVLICFSAIPSACTEHALLRALQRQQDILRISLDEAVPNKKSFLVLLEIFLGADRGKWEADHDQNFPPNTL